MPDSASRSLRVFLCHSSDDKSTVRDLYRRLNAEGWIDPWFDEEKLLPGQVRNLEIEKAVEASDVILVCLTNNSINKEGSIQRELRIVLEQADYKPEGKLFLIPVRLEDCELPRQLRHWQYANYFPLSNRDDAYARLLVSLRNRAHDLAITSSQAESIFKQGQQSEIRIQDPHQAPSLEEIQWTAPQSQWDEQTWNQLHIHAQENRSLTFTLVSGDSRIEESVQGIQRGLIDSLIREVVARQYWDQGLAASMFELMIPKRLKGLFKDLKNVLFILDQETAKYPWEFIYDRKSAHAAPLATQIGMVRQLSTAPIKEREIDKSNRNIFVVGNPAYPPKELNPNLPGVEQQARLVAEKFHEYKFAVYSEIHTSSSSIISRFYSMDYRVLHLTGHGVYRYPFKPSKNEEPVLYTGMVLGDGVFLTANELKTLVYIPELVFMDCPHSGVIDSSNENSSTSASEFAASLPPALLDIGVKAVVVAGWSVNDEGALTFVDIFYDRLLKGETVGNAVKEARQGTYELHKDRTNTWAAYQCYGDPTYRLILDEE